MKKTILLILTLMTISYCHSKATHQYITREAYNLLKLNLGFDIPVLMNHLDTNFPADAGGPYQLAYITRGAWREDEEDPVYNYFSGNPPQIYGDYLGHITIESELYNAILGDFLSANFDPWISITHFWNPDAGDLENSHIHTKSLTDNFYVIVPNAYQKLLRYENGGYDFYVNAVVWGLPTNADGSGSCAQQRAIVHFTYNSLIDLYKNKRLYVTKVTWLTGQEVTYTNRYKFNKQNWVAVSASYDSFLDNIVFETLGRMCHLLEDMSVPEHVHLDEHGPFSNNSDYENFMANDRFWNYSNVNNSVGPFIDPYISSNPLHYLMYTTAQISDHFGSNGPYKGDGNNNFGGNPLPEELTYLNSLNISSFGQPTGMTYPISNVGLLNIRDKLIPQAIRATAGLLYWFAKETNILPPPPLSATISGPSTAPCATGTWSANVSGGYPPYTYQWYQMYASGGGIESSLQKGTIAIQPYKQIDTWYPVGNNTSTLNYYLCGGNSYIRVDVKDSHNTLKSVQQYVAGGNGGGGVVLPKSEANNSTTLSKADLEIPKEYNLEQNYPNPFNPSTMISYSIKTEGKVSLKIYNTLGQEIRTLVDEIKPAGNYLVEFNASELPSGIYIYRMQSGDYLSIKKMLLIK